MTTSLSFAVAPHGLAPHVDFDLREIEGATGLFSLEARGGGGIRLFILDAAVYLPDYSPVVSDEDCVALDLHEASDALLFVVATPGGTATTVNLLAPIVVNASTGASAQVILDGQDWPLRWELAAAQA
jgi:flagellar assembly factor FliW